MHQHTSIGITPDMWIKICGITNLSDAEAIAASGADAVGLNFYAPSKRYVAPDVAVSIRELIGNRLEVVGVFVNSSVDEVVDICCKVKLDVVQFHGDESATTLADFQSRCPDVRLIRAYRIGTDGFADVDRSIAEIHAAGVTLYAVLIDAFMPGEFGGTGHQVNPAAVRDWDKPAEINQRVILAGGLRPDNVATAAAIAAPWGVDTASGVEISPRLKSGDKVDSFVSQLRIPK